MLEPSISSLRKKLASSRTEVVGGLAPAPKGAAEQLSETLAGFENDLDLAADSISRLKSVYPAKPGGMARRQVQVAAAVCLGGTVTSGLTFALGQRSWLTLPFALALTFALPGLGWTLVFRRWLAHRWGIAAFVLSCVWSTAVALFFAWTTFNSPVLQFCLLSAPAVVGGYAGLRRDPTDRDLAPSRRIGVRPWIAVGGGSLLMASTVCIGYGIQHARGRFIDVAGLLPVLGPVYAVGIGLAMLAVLLALALSRESTTLAVAAMAVLGGAFTATPSLLSATPAEAWGFKHLGVVDLIYQHHPLTNAFDVLQQWPGFFAVGAQIQTLTGVPPIDYSTWGEAFFTALTAIGIGVCANQFFGSRRVVLIAVLIYLSTLWVGQMYYAPQSYTFALTLLTYPLVLDVIGSLSQAPMNRAVLARKLPWFFRRLPTRRFLPRGDRTAYVVLIILAYLVVVVTHQLSPYAVLIQLSPFWLTRWLHRRWRAGYVLLGVIALVWLAVHYRVLGTTSALTGFSFSNVSSVVTGPTSPEQRFASQCAHLVVLLVVVGLMISVVTYYRRLGVIIVPLVMSITPAFILLGGSYGGEAIYRVWVFALPFMAIVIAYRLATMVRFRALGITAVAAACLVAWFASAQAMSFGMFSFRQTTATEVAASKWLTSETPRGSQIVYLTSAFPGRIDAGYDARNPQHSVNDPSLMEYPAYKAGKLMAMSVDSLAAQMSHDFGPRTYLVITSNMEREGRYYGDLRKGDVSRLSDSLAGSAQFAKVFTNADTVVFQLAPS